MSKDNILKHVDENWQALVESMGGLSDKELMEPNVCGNWSIRDLMCHISTWEEEARQYIPLILAGESTPRYSKIGGISAFNDRAQEGKKDYSLSRVKREFRYTHHVFKEYLESIPESVFMNNARLAKRVQLDGYAHYAEHTAQIESWRASRI